MTDGEALDALRLVCVEHNIQLMERLTETRSFAGSWSRPGARRTGGGRRGLSGYHRVLLPVFGSIPQKVQTLAFLYELLMHRGETSAGRRRHSWGHHRRSPRGLSVKERPVDSKPLGTVTDVSQWKLWLGTASFSGSQADGPAPKLDRLYAEIHGELPCCSTVQAGRSGFWITCWPTTAPGGRGSTEAAFQLLDTLAALPMESMHPEPERETILALCRGIGPLPGADGAHSAGAACLRVFAAPICRPGRCRTLCAGRTAATVPPGAAAAAIAGGGEHPAAG